VIQIIDNILTVKECNDLIAIHKASSDKWKAHTAAQHHLEKAIFILNLESANAEYQEYIKTIKNKLLNISKKIIPDIKIEWSEVVEWEPNTHMDWHLDSASTKTIITSLTYLNDNYRGGETQLIGGINIPPVIGRTVIFDGNKYKHSVTPIIENPRYTLPIWYTLK